MNRIYGIEDKGLANQRLAGAGWTVQQHSPMSGERRGHARVQNKAYSPVG